MGTKWKTQTEVTPSQFTAGDGVPVQRANGNKGWADLSKIVPPGFAFTQNAANSAEFKSLVIANDPGFTATSPGTVEATNFRLAQGNWNTTDAGGTTHVYSNSGLVIGFNCKAVQAGDEMRVDTSKHALAVVIDSNRLTNFGMISEFAVRFKNRTGTAHFEALRFNFGNSPTGSGAHPTGEFLHDARIGVSGERGARGCDFLGWTAGGSMGWSAGNFNADVFVASIRQNELLYYYDDGSSYPFINMRLRQISRLEVDMDFGKENDADASPNNYNTTPAVPAAFIRFYSRPWSGTWPSAASMVLGLARTPSGTTAHGAPKDPMGTTQILAVYTGNAVNATKGIVIRGGRRGSDTANSGNLFEVQETSDGGATGTATWSFNSSGQIAVATSQLAAGATKTALEDKWINFTMTNDYIAIVVNGTTKYIPCYN